MISRAGIGSKMRSLLAQFHYPRKCHGKVWEHAIQHVFVGKQMWYWQYRQQHKCSPNWSRQIFRHPRDLFPIPHEILQTQDHPVPGKEGHVRSKPRSVRCARVNRSQRKYAKDVFMQDATTQKCRKHGHFSRIALFSDRDIYSTLLIQNKEQCRLKHTDDRDDTISSCSVPWAFHVFAYSNALPRNPMGSNSW